MSDPRQPPDDAPPWEMAELISEHALDDVPWDRPAELPWPEPELDAMTWNERWNVAAYDPDYPLPPQRVRTPGRAAVTAAAAAVGAGAAGSHALRFGRPIRDPEELEADDPYDEYAPLADDLEAPGQLTWTGGTVPLRAVASAEGPPPAGPAQLPPAQPRPAVEPPTWSRSSRSVFGDFFAGAGQPARSLPSPDPGSRPEARRVEPPSVPLPLPVDEWPPIPADFQPQWASVAPVKPAWSPAPATTKPARTPPAPPTWVNSSAPTPPVDRPPAPPPPSRSTALGHTTTPPLTPVAVGGGVAAGLPAARPLPPLRPIIPARQAPPPAARILPDDYYEPAQASQEAGDAEAEGNGPSTIWTLFWMAVTGVVVVGLVLAFLHFMTGVFR